MTWDHRQYPQNSTFGHDAINLGDHVYIWSRGSVPDYMVGKRGTVTKINRKTVRVEIDPRDHEAATRLLNGRVFEEPTVVNVTPSSLRPTPPEAR